MFCQSPFCKHDMLQPSANGRELSECRRQISSRASVIGKGKGPSGILRYGRTASRTSCRPTKGRFPPSAESLSTRDDRFGQPEAGKLFHISNRRPADEGYGGCSVPRRPGPVPEPNAALRVGVMGEAGDFKCLTFVKLKPRPFRKPGLFFKQEPRCSASWVRWRPLSLTCTCRISERAPPPEPAAYSFCTTLTWCRWPAVARCRIGVPAQPATTRAPEANHEIRSAM